MGLRHCGFATLPTLFPVVNFWLPQFKTHRIRTRVSIQKELALLLLRVTVKDLSFEMKLICSSKTKNYHQKYLKEIKANHSICHSKSSQEVEKQVYTKKIYAENF